MTIVIPLFNDLDTPRPDGDIAALAANVKHTIAKKLKKKKLVDEHGDPTNFDPSGDSNKARTRVSACVKLVYDCR